MSILGETANDSAPLRRRSKPTSPALLAAAGSIVAASGPLLIGGDRIDPLDKGLSTLPGAGLTTAAAVIGYLLMARFPTRPLATAGSIVAVFSVPAAFFFITGGDDPISLTGILSMSALVYLTSWVIGPARHRAVFLGAGLVALWLFAREVLDPMSQTAVGEVLPVPPGEIPIPGVPVVPVSVDIDFLASGAVSILFGVAYLVLAEWFDRRSWHGASIAPAAAGLLAITGGVSFLSAELDLAATGFVSASVGLGLAVYGSRRARRVTTRVGAAGVSLGALLFVGELTSSATTTGITLIVIGSAIVAAAWFGQSVLSEGDEVEAPADRLSTRPDPGAAVAVAAAATVLVLLGVVILGADALGGLDGGSRVLGVVLTALLVAAGLALLIRGGQSPLGSAGSVALLTAIPALMFFATFNIDPPELFSPLLVLVVSTLAWAGTWFWSKRTVFLAAAVFAGWILLLEVIESAVSFVTAADGLLGWILYSAFPADRALRDIPDPTVLGLITLAVAIGGLVLGGVLDRRGLIGPVTALAPPVVICSVVGVLFLADDLDQAGSAVFLIALGCVLAADAARGGRRASAWSGVAIVVLGLNLLITEFVDTATSIGLVSVVVGAAVVAAAQMLATVASNEPDEVPSDVPPVE